MLTTAGLTRSATSAKLMGKVLKAAVATGGAGAASSGADHTAAAAGLAGGGTAGAGENDPVALAPTSTPTVAEKPAEIHAKRRVMASL